ncbi:hypothetical protein BW730_12510 [Tessaracoccus aquimaris]|uniref:SD-repeat containing protein B domain-containing protein n=1 Tax=Tessaracoccus aquimaris TaxID=1332264 RepID=A0A1Q2CQ04_9ACTN|nr:hypothetical protein [Tessaracoccus aquimaris]AQP48201.1 hypothetical protein BW730_12510 [Tessaracoccus aquimaris]
MLNQRGDSAPKHKRRGLGWLNVAIAVGLIGGFSAGLAQPANAAPGDLAFGKVIVDSNKNDAIDSGPVGTNDTPLAGVKVTLQGSDATIPGVSVTTDAQGNWAFLPADATTQGLVRTP